MFLEEGENQVAFPASADAGDNLDESISFCSNQSSKVLFSIKCQTIPFFVDMSTNYGAAYYTTKSGLRTKSREFPAADLSGLSLPDAPCERTDIRERAENLTRGVRIDC